MLTYETSISRVCSLIGNIEAEASGEVRESDCHSGAWQILGFSKVPVEWMTVFGSLSHSDRLGYVSKQSQQEYCEMFTNWGDWCIMVSDSNYYIHIYDSWSSSRNLIFIHQLCHCFKNRRSAPFILLGAFTFGKW